ncbi:alpha-1A adrenergic receptor [Triplophysa dalaica]|uniref:alpha-1A adrenergic receptor n=1 Tax=Triplophysa dalaica TaxID=1582913 RepID=UPI0024DF46FB|nr:alpha-1A adrenergic receptor [Triplophysa dalaica]XP_056592327.1 alpha-1A adrenergic receptor [Triplophysa dalaica]XP_056592329.1 alpha-1A adrenergic receptor [Triplophysa dalaica]
MTNGLLADDNISSTFFPQSCPNCSVISPFDIDISKSLALGLVLMVFMIFGVMGNILVILSVACHRHLRSMTHYFVANLAVADLLLSSMVLPFSAASEALGCWAFGRSLCNAWTALDVLCCTASILSLTVISVDRCVAVSYPLQYPSLATGRRALGAVVVLWSFSIAISVGPLLGWRDPMPEDESVCRVNEEQGYAIFSAACSFYVPLTVILAMYCRVYVVARHKSKSMRKGRETNGLTKHGVMLRIHCRNAVKKEAVRSSHAFVRLLKFSREKKAAKTLGIVVGCFVLCWLPFFLVLPISSIFPSHRPSDTVFKITFWLGYFNSCLNPIIYPCFSQEFKKAFQNVLRCHCLSRTQRVWSPPVRFQDATTLHAPKLVSPFSFQTSVDINNALPKVVALTENDHSKINVDDMQKQTHAETKVPSIKVHQVSICMTEGEAL